MNLAMMKMNPMVLLSARLQELPKNGYSIAMNLFTNRSFA